MERDRLRGKRRRRVKGSAEKRRAAKVEGDESGKRSRGRARKHPWGDKEKGLKRWEERRSVERRGPPTATDYPAPLSGFLLYIFTSRPSFISPLKYSRTPCPSRSPFSQSQILPFSRRDPPH
ncbi:unnamed protein product [Pleuronectes platessa]|uniref:Uncharacterized protein n=1 Tax=Pleuronectes platessa TaxID=8262 RepID=A0A9N7TQM2_PLEPL|nr:unnamed protein product [Pleuronectes platessa]